MYLNTCCPNLSHTIRYTKCITRLVDQTNPIPARTQNESQRELTEDLPYQRVNKMHLYMYHFHASEDTKWISRSNPSHVSENRKCVDQIHPMQARTQNVCQYLLTEPIPFMRGNKIYLQFVDKTPPMTARAQNFITTCVEQTHPMAAKT
jgi:hypothetical protein